jgi:hypothetical protein
MIARAEVAVAKLAAVERHVPQIGAAVLHGMEQAAHLPFLFYETEVFAAVDDLVELCVVLGITHHFGKGGQVVPAIHSLPEKRGPFPELLHEGFFRAVGVIVQTAAGPAGLAGIRLAKVDEIVLGHIAKPERLYSDEGEISNSF